MSIAFNIDASRWLSDFQSKLTAGNIEGVASLFHENCFWRDLVAFTWNIKTLEGRLAIRDMLQTQLEDVAPSSFRLSDEAAEVDGSLECWFAFETRAGHGIGHLRLRDGRAWTLLTTMNALKGFEEKSRHTRPLGASHGVEKHPRSWLDERVAEGAALGREVQPYCLIIGGGQGGIALAARLRQLDVPTLVVDRNSRPGDAWRNRYKSLCLHDPVWYDHLPYIDFPPNWPVFAPKDKIGDWLEMYTRIMEINYWGSTEAVKASYDEADREWNVILRRGDENVIVRPKQLVLATGVSGMPSVPKIPGFERFLGQQHHSSLHPGGHGFANKKCVVIGSNNSAHDISADLWAHDADVTMVQRSSTHVIRSETAVEHLFKPLYSEDALHAGITTERADLIFASMPYKLMAQAHIPLFEKIAEVDKTYYERLRTAGFMLDFGDDGSGTFQKYLRRGSGYYVDVGASDLIARGEIKLKSRVGVREITEESVVLSDGTKLEADLIVYATGFGSMNEWAAQIISREVADKVGKCWGLGSGTTKDRGPWEGELRNMWKPTQLQALWFHGGNLHQSRHYSKYLSLQIKARKEGIPTPVYGLQEVHHKN
ncbi:FAD-dependent oxidoreductase [Bradyrhizobium sp. LTSPM299]|uniref:NAD(P)/FAD-dependent oxidoreductase n=1 Tax=Bradyrhizobium sp. LTSPM299 TaxID=1619233 RepID=UPI0005CAE224|nr:NAD(P)/FAD-dependent oxidoreductase [Bradyrhizobium sp. LTSPM299]KJC54073.1 FAD-dependent oxidoreductase [Bradyrhizobium sp. LTSPM299]